MTIVPRKLATAVAMTNNIDRLFKRANIRQVLRRFNDNDNDGFGPGHAPGGRRSGGHSDPTQAAALQAAIATTVTHSTAEILERYIYWGTHLEKRLAEDSRPTVAYGTEKRATRDAETRAGEGTCAACGHECSGLRSQPGRRDDRIRFIDNHALCPTHYQQCSRQATARKLTPIEHVSDYVASTRNIYGLDLVATHEQP